MCLWYLFLCLLSEKDCVFYIIQFTDSVLSLYETSNASVCLHKSSDCPNTRDNTENTSMAIQHSLIWCSFFNLQLWVKTLKGHLKTKKYSVWNQNVLKEKGFFCWDWEGVRTRVSASSCSVCLYDIFVGWPELEFELHTNTMLSTVLNLF